MHVWASVEGARYVGGRMNGEETPVPREDLEVPAEQVRIVCRDDLHRSRLTVFFRFILAIPHLIVVGIFGLLAFLMAFINWFAILFSGRAVQGDLTDRFIRYYVHVYAYLYLAANKFPPFGGGDDYAVDLEIQSVRRQSRWKTGFRLILAVPALMLAFTLTGSGTQYSGDASTYGYSLGSIAVAAFLGWFASMARGRMPRGLRDLLVYGLGYTAQAYAYFLLVTDKYPDSDPLRPDYGEPAPDHPVRISCDDDLRRSRLTVFFRFFLFLPHLVWLLLWGIVVLFTAIANWFVTLFAGRPAGGLHRFNAAYVRYVTHVFAFVYLVANPFPGFTGKAGSYPVDLQIPPPERQNRWKTGFRLILAIPTWLIASAIGSAFGLVALFGWFAGLFTGRMPRGLRNLGVFALRYSGQYYAYAILLTDHYPFSGPSLESVEAAPPEPVPVPEPA
jgi:hypothetical protein